MDQESFWLVLQAFEMLSSLQDKNGIACVAVKLLFRLDVVPEIMDPNEFELLAFCQKRLQLLYGVDAKCNVIR
jgi:hypothetical protein